MARTTARPRGAQLIAIVSVVVLALVVGALAVFAYRQANQATPSESAAPVPTFTLGVETQSPTPTPPPVSETAPRETERFLSAASGTLWRAVTGACGAVAPLVERSNDGGDTWVDVTPGYLGIAQVASLDGLAVDAVETVAAVGAACETQALRSYTNGRFWEPYPDVLAAARYIDAADPSVVHIGNGAVDAPCADARGLDASGPVVALVCERAPYVWANNAWLTLPAPDAAAVTIAGADVLVAHVDEGCAGLAITRFVNADPTQPRPSGCAEGVDPTQPVAIAESPAEILVWSGDTLITVP